MKYAIILCDGMADRPVDCLGGKTPMEVAVCPNLDRIAAKARVGRMRTLYEELPTGSDVANLSVLGYDPHTYYTGRSPIEALGLGIALKDTDMVFRMNLVTISDDANFADKTMIDHSSDKITTEEANVIGGLGSAVCEFVAENCPVPVVRHGVYDEFGRSGAAKKVLAAYGLDAEHIAEAARKAVARK